MSDALTEAADYIRSLNSATSPLKWTRIEDVSFHRDNLARLIDTSVENYPQPLKYAVKACPNFEPLDASRLKVLPLVLREFVQRQYESRIAFAKAHFSKDAAEFVNAQRALFPSLFDTDFDDEVGAFWTVINGCTRTGRGAEYSTAEAVARLEQELEIRNLSWQVRLSEDNQARLSISSADRAIVVREGARFSGGELDSLIRHEIDGHVLRWHKALSQPNPLLAIPMGDYFPTEEGLAVSKEVVSGEILETRAQTFIARVRSVLAADAGGLGVLPLARFLVSECKLDSSQAAQVALRTKRGLADCNEPGAFYKDAGYLVGYNLVATLNEEDHSLLDRCKWGADGLDLLRSEAQFLGLEAFKA